MKRIKKIATNIFLITLSLTFLFSCAFIEKQTQRDTKEAPAKSEEVKPRPKAVSPKIKDTPQKDHDAADEKQEVHKPAPSTPPLPEPDKLSPQQNYYNIGMRYYSQDKYSEAKKAWQEVIKLGKRTALADKARENIKKVDHILKTLEGMSGR